MTSSVSLTQLYDILSLKFGKQEAQSIVQFIETKIETKVEEQTKGLATREDVLNLEVRMEKGFKEVEKSIRTQSQWMLGIFITLALMVLGLYATLIFK
jgi:hypothetical protein